MSLFNMIVWISSKYDGDFSRRFFENVIGQYDDDGLLSVNKSHVLYALATNSEQKNPLSKKFVFSYISLRIFILYC